MLCNVLSSNRKSVEQQICAKTIDERGGSKQNVSDKYKRNKANQNAKKNINKSDDEFINYMLTSKSK